MAEPSPPSEQSSVLQLYHIAAGISPDLASDFARLAGFSITVPELAPIVEPLKRIDAWSQKQTSHRESCRNLLHKALKIIVLISDRSQDERTDPSELSPTIEQTVTSIFGINDNIYIWTHIPLSKSSRWHPTIEATINEQEERLKSLFDHLSEPAPTAPILLASSSEGTVPTYHILNTVTPNFPPMMSFDPSQGDTAAPSPQPPPTAGIPGANTGGASAAPVLLPFGATSASTAKLTFGFGGALPAFGSTAFGSTTPTNKPVFGQPAYGASTTLASGRPAFGASTTPVFTGSAFGAPAFGAATTPPVFGKPAFGQTGFRTAAPTAPAFAGFGAAAQKSASGQTSFGFGGGISATPLQTPPTAGASGSGNAVSRPAASKAPSLESPRFTPPSTTQPKVPAPNVASAGFGAFNDSSTNPTTTPNPFSVASKPKKSADILPSSGAFGQTSGTPSAFSTLGNTSKPSAFSLAKPDGSLPPTATPTFGAATSFGTGVTFGAPTARKPSLSMQPVKVGAGGAFAGFESSGFGGAAAKAGAQNIFGGTSSIPPAINMEPAKPLKSALALGNASKSLDSPSATPRGPRDAEEEPGRKERFPESENDNKEPTQTNLDFLASPSRNGSDGLSSSSFSMMFFGTTRPQSQATTPGTQTVFVPATPSKSPQSAIPRSTTAAGTATSRADRRSSPADSTTPVGSPVRPNPDTGSSSGFSLPSPSTAANRSEASSGDFSFGRPTQGVRGKSPSVAPGLESPRFTPPSTPQPKVPAPNFASSGFGAFNDSSTNPTTTPNPFSVASKPKKSADILPSSGAFGQTTGTSSAFSSFGNTSKPSAFSLAKPDGALPPTATPTFGAATSFGTGVTFGAPTALKPSSSMQPVKVGVGGGFAGFGSSGFGGFGGAAAKAGAQNIFGGTSSIPPAINIEPAKSLKSALALGNASKSLDSPSATPRGPRDAEEEPGRKERFPESENDNKEPTQTNLDFLASPSRNGSDGLSSSSFSMMSFGTARPQSQATTPGIQTIFVPATPSKSPQSAIPRSTTAAGTATPRADRRSSPADSTTPVGSPVRPNPDTGPSSGFSLPSPPTAANRSEASSGGSSFGRPTQGVRGKSPSKAPGLESPRFTPPSTPQPKVPAPNFTSSGFGAFKDSSTNPTTTPNPFSVASKPKKSADILPSSGAFGQTSGTPSAFSTLGNTSKPSAFSLAKPDGPLPPTATPTFGAATSFGTGVTFGAPTALKPSSSIQPVKVGAGGGFAGFGSSGFGGAAAKAGAQNIFDGTSSIPPAINIEPAKSLKSALALGNASKSLDSPSVTPRGPRDAEEEPGRKERFPESENDNKEPTQTNLDIFVSTSRGGSEGLSSSSFSMMSFGTTRPQPQATTPGIQTVFVPATPSKSPQSAVPRSTTAAGTATPQADRRSSPADSTTPVGSPVRLNPDTGSSSGFSLPSPPTAANRSEASSGGFSFGQPTQGVRGKSPSGKVPVVSSPLANPPISGASPTKSAAERSVDTEPDTSSSNLSKQHGKAFQMPMPADEDKKKPAARPRTPSGVAALEKWAKFVTVVPGQHGRFKMKTGSSPIYGGFSDVWECDAKFSDGMTIAVGVSGKRAIVAVKKFRAVRINRDADENTVNGKLLKRLTKELEIWMALKHPNITPLLGFVLLGDLCIISPWYSNGNVANYISRHPEADRIKLVSDVACGLAYLHNRALPVIHGDMKPDNVLIDETGDAVIIDFGLSSVMEDESTLATSFTSASLQDAGNARWMAPELLMKAGRTRSFSTDIYSFGCVALFIYTGETPFKGIPYIQIIHALIQGKKPIVNRGDYPAISTADAEWFYRLLVSCWSAKPSSRPSIGIVEERLRSGHTTDIEVTTAQHGSSPALPMTTPTAIPVPANPSSSPPSHSIPTPAAAPPSTSPSSAPSAPPASFKFISFGSNSTNRALPRALTLGAVTAIIRVECDGPPSARGYLSRMPDQVGRHVIARSKEAMALQVQYYPSSLPVNLKLLNSTTQFSYLAGIWYGNNIVFRPGSTNYVNIAAGDGHSTSFTRSAGQGPSHTAIWFVEATGQIRAAWRDETNTGTLIELFLAVHESGQDLVFVLDFDAFATRYLPTRGVYYKGSLVLEPYEQLLIHEPSWTPHLRG